MCPWNASWRAAWGLGLVLLLGGGPALVAAADPPKPPLPAVQKKRIQEKDRAWAEYERLMSEAKLREALTAAEKAVALERLIFGDTHPQVGKSLVETLAGLYAETGDAVRARKAAEEGLVITRKHYDDKDWHTADARRMVAHVERLARMSTGDRARVARADVLLWQSILRNRQGKGKEAVALALQAARLLRDVLGPDHPDTANALVGVRNYLYGMRDWPAAQKYAEQALTASRKALGDNHPRTARQINSLGYLLYVQGKSAQARKLYEQALPLFRTLFGKDKAVTADVLVNLADALKDLAEYREAQTHLEEALAIRRNVFGEWHLQTAYVLLRLATVLRKQGNLPEARRTSEQALAIIRKARGEMHLETATALNGLGLVLMDRGDYPGARKCYEQVLAIRKKILGENHPQTASVLNNLAVLLIAQEDYATARRFCEQVLAVYQKARGENDPRVATALNNLAQCLSGLEEYAGACPLLEKSLAIRRKTFGNNHPDTALALNNLGMLLRKQGKYLAARPYLEQALAIYRKALGEAHPDSIMALGNLGLLCRDQARYPEAKTIFEQVLALWKKARGEDHPLVAHALEDLAGLYRTQGDYPAARKYGEQALALRKKVEGINHIHTARSLSKLAEVLWRQGDFPGARALVEQSLATFRKVLGENHPNTRTVLNDLAMILIDQGDFTAARNHLERVLEGYQKNLGPDRPSTANVHFVLAGLLQTIGEDEAARQHVEKALAIYRNVYGIDHPLTARALAGVGAALQQQGYYVAARACFEQGLAVLEKTRGVDDQRTAHAHNLLGVLLSAQGDTAPALSHYRKALAIYRKVLGEDHYLTAKTLNNVAVVLQKEKQYGEAEVYQQKALRIYQKVYGDRHPETAFYHANLADMLRDSGKPTEGLEHYKTALAIYVEFYGKDHPEIASTHQGLGNLLRDGGDYAGARRHLEKALAIRRKVRGNDHPTTAVTLFALGNLLVAQGKFADARPLYEEAFRSRSRLYRDVLPNLAESEALTFIDYNGPGRNPLLSAYAQLPNIPAEQAYRVVWQTRGVVGRMLARRRHSLGAGGPARKLWDKLRNTRTQLARLTLAAVSPEFAAARSKQLAALVAEKEDLERQLGKVSAAFRRQQQAQEIDFPALLERLPANVAVVDLVQVLRLEAAEGGKGGPRETLHYEGFVLRKTSGKPGYTVAWVHLGPAAPIDQAVRTWRRQLTSRGGRASPGEGPAAHLRRLVWGPVEGHLPGCTAVLVVPDGALTGVPWAALPGRRPGSFLLEDYALAVPASGQQLYDLLTRPAPAAGGCLVVGGVRYDADPAAAPLMGALLAQRGPALRTGERPTWRYLPGTEQEAQQIQALWPRPDAVTLLQGKAASVAALRQRLSQARFVHLATHGFFADARFRSAFGQQGKGEQLFGGDRDRTRGRGTVTGRNPLVLSGVVLVGANRPPRRNADGLPAGDGGILTAEEVAGLDLSGCELAVLSACETGLGEVAGGEGVLGLQRAFHLAGARTTIASLWKVDDAATQRLMALFYDNLWQKKLPKAEALRQAQLALLRDPTGAGSRRGFEVGDEERTAVRTDLRLWAAWTLSGDPGDLSAVRPVVWQADADTPAPQSAASRPSWPWFVGGGGLGAALAAGFIRRRRRLGTA